MGLLSSHDQLTYEEQIRLDSGKPVMFEGGIKITKNPKTGLLEGVPEQWANNYELPFQIDYSKLQKTKNLPESIRANEQLPDQIIKLINSIPVQFSLPIQTYSSEIKSSGLKSSGLKSNCNDKQKQCKVNESLSEENEDILIDIYADPNSQLMESHIQTELLSTSQFNKKKDNVLFIQENPAIKFVFQKQLGKGAMCKVYFAYDKKQQKRGYYACRIIKLKDERTLSKIRTQIAVMQLCNSSNLAKHFFTYYYKQSLFMFVEFMDAGAMVDFVYHYRKKIPQPIIAYFLKEILQGLESLHSRRQLHRDLKSDNVLLNLFGQVKIADFGFAIQLTKEVLNRKSLVGTPAWMAPELICKNPYDEKVDIWSLGMVAMELVLGQPPFLRMNQQQAMQRIVNKEPPRLTCGSQSLINFVDCCLQKKAEDRKSAKQLLDHQFIKQIGKGVKEKEQLIKMLRTMNKHSLQSVIRGLPKVEQ